MADEPKPYSAILTEAAKRYGTPSIATAALAMSIAALAAGGEPSPTATSSQRTSEPLSLAVPNPTSTGPRKRLDITTDADVSPGASITASGKVDLGSRLVDIALCVGQYSDATRICVLSPGPWEMHSACYERGLEPATTCEVTVRNTGTVPLKFSGYMEVAASATERASTSERGVTPP